jgi:oligopeptide/dipeptide ABC transporter ATP-binding protein
VMYASRLMETGDLDDIFYESRNPYTLALLNSIPDLEGVKESLQAIPGNPPSLLNPPSGCAFRPRCEYAIDECAASEPPVVQLGDGHASRCHRTSEVGVDLGVMA